MVIDIARLALLFSHQHNKGLMEMSLLLFLNVKYHGVNVFEGMGVAQRNVSRITISLVTTFAIAIKKSPLIFYINILNRPYNFPNACR